MAIDIIGAYRNVCRDLEGLDIYMAAVNIRLQQAVKVVYGGKMPSSEPCYVPLTTSLVDYNYAVDEYNETSAMLEHLRDAKSKLEAVICKMSDVEQIVIALHVEQGMNLREVAEKANYSYVHIRRTANELRYKMITENVV
jgi:DNA-directed RNA polymerase specialized sigma subunit